MSYFKSEVEAVKIKQKTMLILLIITSLIAGLNIYKNISSMKNEFDTRIKDKINKANYFFDSSLDSLTTTYNARANCITYSQNTLEYIKSKDRKKLYENIKIRYDLLKHENPYLTTMQFLDVNNTSILRLHALDKFDDNVSGDREILCDSNRDIKHLSGFEVCNNGLLYRVVNPLFLNNEFIGMLEFGIAPEYLITKIDKLVNTKSVILVPTKVLNKLPQNKQHNVTLDNYTVINENSLFHKAIQQYPKLLEKNNYQIEIENRTYFVNHTDFTFKTHTNEQISKILIFDDITKNVYDYESYVINTITFNILNILIVMILIHFSFGYIINRLKAVNKEMEFSKIYFQSLFDTQPNMIIVSDGVEIIDANKSFLDFVEYNDIHSYKRDYKCVCEMFEDKDKDGYLLKTQINQNWIEKILQNIGNKHKVAIVKNDKEYIFDIRISHISIDKTIRNIITFADITQTEKFNETLQDEIKNNNIKLHKANEEIIKQSKLSNMTEMLSMIAHQWRQPLSTVSTITSNLRIELMFNDIDKENLDKSLSNISSITQQLSNTIESFREFLNPSSKEKKDVNIKELIDKAIEKVNVNNIKIIKDVSDISIKVYKSEIIQVFVNLIQNSLDAIANTKPNKPQIKFMVHQTKDDIKIIIEDNGGGIKDDIMSKIFEPYFSTKSKNDNGLGLYISKLIIENHLQGSIECYNNEFGATFVISLKK